MENVDEQLRINIRSILCSISENTVNGIIHALKYAGLETISDLQFAQEEDLILVLKPIPRRKLIKTWSKQNLDLQTKPAIPPEDGQTSPLSPSSSHEDLAAHISPGPCAEDEKSFSSESRSLSQKDLTAQTSPATAVEDEQTTSSKNPSLSHEDFQPLHNAVFWQLAGTNYQVQRPVPLNSANVSLRTYQTVGSRVTPDLSETSPATPAEDVQASSSESLSSSHEDLTVQASLATDEEDGQSSCSENSSLSHEDWQPSRNAVSWQLTGKSHQVLRTVPVNTANVPLRTYQTVGGRVPSSSFSCLPSENSNRPRKFRWRKHKRLELLKLYAKYKNELLCPDKGKKWKIWEKIAAEIHANNPHCNASRCYNKIKELRQQYETYKSKSVITQRQYAFLEEAKEAFETNENSGISNVTVLWTWNKKRSLCLLEVYGKYKLLCSSKVQEVWEKIALEVRKACLINCDEVQCRNRIDEMKCEYEAIKKEKVKTRNAVKFLEAARIVFETNENSDFPDCHAGEVNKKVCKYIPPHMRNGDNKLEESSEATKRVYSIKVKNLSEDATESDLHKLFRSIGGTIPRYVRTMKDKSDQSKHVAFIKFDKKEDAIKAILAGDGIEFNKQVLKVEWAGPLQEN